MGQNYLELHDLTYDPSHIRVDACVATTSLSML